MIENLIFFLSSPPLLLQAVINGLVIGSLFALAAYGMALVWGVMDLINVAKGELVILGGYVALYSSRLLGLPPLLTVPLAAVTLFFVGLLLYRLVVFRVVGKELFTSILATFGISIFLQQAMNLGFGADVQVLESHLGASAFMDDQVIIPNIRFVALFLAVVIGILIFFFMRYTRLGLAIRATAQNSRAAKMVGIPTEKIYALTFALSSAICGAAGALVAMTFTIHPYIGLPYTIRSFVIVIFAGIGNLPGVILSAITLGTIEEAADFVLGTEFRLAFVFGLLVLLLVMRNWLLVRKRSFLR